MSKNNAAQPTQNQRIKSKPTVWSKEKSDLLRKVAKQSKPSDCNCACGK